MLSSENEYKITDGKLIGFNNGGIKFHESIDGVVGNRVKAEIMECGGVNGTWQLKQLCEEKIAQDKKEKERLLKQKKKP